MGQLVTKRMAEHGKSSKVTVPDTTQENAATATKIQEVSETAEEMAAEKVAEPENIDQEMVELNVELLPNITQLISGKF
jgi:hypothetical protein